MAASIVLVLVALAPQARAQLAIDWVTVTEASNPCEIGPHGCLGSVAVDYRIGAQETTTAQYVAFLNAVAASDPFGLYNPAMTSDVEHGGIERSGTEPFSYSAKMGFEQRPVGYVSYWDALRFANWLHNGQPSGAQDASTTEDGAYTITVLGISENSIVRNTLALAFVANDDEWYKAAYYAGAGNYFVYPTSSDSEPACVAPTSDPDTANCGGFGESTDVARYSGSTSPSGTFDQGGNIREWTGTIVGSTRTMRGGTYLSGSAQLASNVRWSVSPAGESASVGFRVASPVPGALPVPALDGLAPFALFALLAGLGTRQLRRVS